MSNVLSTNSEERGNSRKRKRRRSSTNRRKDLQEEKEERRQQVLHYQHHHYHHNHHHHFHPHHNPFITPNTVMASYESSRASTSTKTTTKSSTSTSSTFSSSTFINSTSSSSYSASTSLPIHYHHQQQQQQHDDPDSRDSGISLGASMASNQGLLLISAIDKVEISPTRFADFPEVENVKKESGERKEVNDEEKEKSREGGAVDGSDDKENDSREEKSQLTQNSSFAAEAEDTVDEEAFQKFCAKSPLKKHWKVRGVGRRRFSRISTHQQHHVRGPTDFSSLRQCKFDHDSSPTSSRSSAPPTQNSSGNHNRRQHQQPNKHKILGRVSSSSSCCIIRTIRNEEEEEFEEFEEGNGEGEGEGESKSSFSSSSCSSSMKRRTQKIHRVRSDSILLSKDRSWESSPEEFENYTLPLVEKPNVRHRAFRSISAETLVGLLESLTEAEFSKSYVLIDCRYPFEFEGGHIMYSLNIWKTEDVVSLFYEENDGKSKAVSKQIPIFYCEYSQKRGPSMAMKIREYDRKCNETRYPYVDYKEIYVLDRGYRHFFKDQNFTKYCSPQSYCPMWDDDFESERKQFDAHLRRVKKRPRVGEGNDAVSPKTTKSAKHRQQREKRQVAGKCTTRIREINY